jgi:hypothetical protein
MNTLWIFGDSFSIEYVDNLHENHKRYVQLKNINEITTWPKFLGDKLNYQVKNLAKGGNSNYEIFQNFCDNCDVICENDIVIIGWALISKFRISYNNKFENIGNEINSSLNMVSKETLIEIQENRKKTYDNKRDRWAEEVYLWENSIRTLSKLKKFKTYFWTAEEPRLIYNLSEEEKKNKNYLCAESKQKLITYLNNLGCTSMSDETNGEVGDSHFGIDGHNKQAEIFYNIITNG